MGHGLESDELMGIRRIYVLSCDVCGRDHIPRALPETVSDARRKAREHGWRAPHNPKHSADRRILCNPCWRKESDNHE